jgi:hypothetical protein
MNRADDCRTIDQLEWFVGTSPGVQVLLKGLSMRVYDSFTLELLGQVWTCQDTIATTSERIIRCFKFSLGAERLYDRLITVNPMLLGTC